MHQLIEISTLLVLLWSIKKNSHTPAVLPFNPLTFVCFFLSATPENRLRSVWYFFHIKMQVFSKGRSPASPKQSRRPHGTYIGSLHAPLTAINKHTAFNNSKKTTPPNEGWRRRAPLARGVARHGSRAASRSNAIRQCNWFDRKKRQLVRGRGDLIKKWPRLRCGAWTNAAVRDKSERPPHRDDKISAGNRSSRQRTEREERRRERATSREA